MEGKVRREAVILEVKHTAAKFGLSAGARSIGTKVEPKTAIGATRSFT
jgi:hypothetical protein